MPTPLAPGEGVSMPGRTVLSAGTTKSQVPARAAVPAATACQSVVYHDGLLMDLLAGDIVSQPPQP